MSASAADCFTSGSCNWSSEIGLTSVFITVAWLPFANVNNAVVVSSPGLEAKVECGYAVVAVQTRAIACGVFRVSKRILVVQRTAHLIPPSVRIIDAVASHGRSYPVG